MTDSSKTGHPAGDGVDSGGGRPRDVERIALATVFFLHGALSGTFGARLPWISDRLHLSSGSLGVGLLGISVGATSAVMLSGRVVQRVGRRTTSLAMMSAAAVILALIPHAPDLPALTAVGVVFGGALATTDMAMNAQAILVEKRLGKSIMSGLHGMWSVGTLSGSMAGSIAAANHVDARAQFAVTALLVVVAVAIATRHYRTEPGDVGVVDDADSAPRIAIPRGRILLIGLVGFCGIFPEIAAQDWSAVFIHKTLAGTEAVAAFTTGMFGVTMALSRLTGDGVVRRWGAGPTVRVCGALGTLGALLIVVARATPVAVAGFMLIGVGVAVVVPLAFAAAGHAGPDPTLGVAGVATVAYGAGLGAPALIGGIAQVTSLRIAFTIVAVATLMIAAGAGLLDRSPTVGAAGPAEAVPAEAAS